MIDHLILQHEAVVGRHHGLKVLARRDRIEELWPRVSLSIQASDVMAAQLLRNDNIGYLRLSEATKGHIDLLSSVFINLRRLVLRGRQWILGDLHSTNFVLQQRRLISRVKVLCMHDFDVETKFIYKTLLLHLRLLLWMLIDVVDRVGAH